jgi:putative ATP-binding cassette transporter
MEPIDFFCIIQPWATQQQVTVAVTDEDGDHLEPPPPEIIEPDPDLSPEEAEQARKDYLLTRFWISARGYWGKNGDRLAWLLSAGLLFLIVANVGFQYGINVWNRAIFDAIEKRDSATVFHLTAIFFPLAVGSVALGVAQVFGRMAIQRPLARLADQFSRIALVDERPLLSAQPCQWRP